MNDKIEIERKVNEFVEKMERERNSIIEKKVQKELDQICGTIEEIMNSKENLMTRKCKN